MPRAFRVVVCLGLLLTFAVAGPPLAAQSPIQYVYDEIGRLIAVIDPSGDTATYTYDAVGNILAIGRHASSAISVISFTPTSGPIGTVVTIGGTGFSATANQNTVTFNGTGATVSAATTTQLTVTVPVGATTGTIGVTSPAGSASSGSAFTVTTSTAPTITSFTPSIGVAGTSVTVSGTNFETTALKNRLKFNVTGSAASASTSTSITTAAPSSASSGHITVTTPNGSVTSSGDFFIAPYPFVASDVIYTGRMGFNDPEAVAISTAAKIGLAVFDATAGHRVSLKIVPGPTGTTTIYKPDGAVLATKTNGIFTELIEPQTLTRTGSYTVLVDPSSPSATGTVTVTAYDVPADTTGSISIDGSANVVIGTPGQNGTLTFSGTSGSRVSVKVTGSPTGTLYLKKPDGSTLSSVGIGSSSFMEPQTLPDTGTYTLLVDPTGANTGTAAVDLYSVVADVTDTITPGGSPVTVTISDPGQNASVTFSGTASQRVSMKLSSGAPSGTVYLKRASGTIVAQPSMGGTFGNFMEPVVLPATETYTLLVDPISAAIGSVTLTLYDVAADITGSITAGGSSVTANVTDPGQNAIYTFSATAGDRVSALLASGAPEALIEIRKTGSFLKSAAGSSGAYIDVQTLPDTGTYTFKFDPDRWSVGTGVLTLYAVPADLTGSLTINGSAVGVTLSVPGQKGTYTFSGTSGQLVTVRATSNTMTLNLYLKKPDGSILASGISASGTWNLAQKTLPTTGTYTVLVDPETTSTGSVNVSVTSP